MSGRRLFALLFLVATAAGAQDAPVVRVDVTPPAVNVGESVQLRVTVLVPTWFSEPPVYPSFELSNAITRLPPNSSYPTSERVGRETWSGIVRNYRVYPMLGATYRLAAQTIRVTYANPGSDPVVVEAPIPEIGFRGVVPPGAEDLDPYLAGRQFSLAREIEGDLDGLEAGDAIVVRYVAELDGLPAIFIPLLAPELAAPGVSVYADEPVIEDGDIGRRTERVTLVFNAGGEVTLPGVDIGWWNTESGRISTASFAPLTFPVAGPAVNPAPADDPVGTDWRPIALSVLAGGLLLLAAVRLRRFVAPRRAARRAAREQSEQFAYRRLLAALNSGDPGEAYRHMLTWVSRVAPGCDLRQFVHAYADAETEAVLDDFIASLYSGQACAPDIGVLASGIAAARRARLRRAGSAPMSVLPPLNP